jgi:hypothetical protein
MTTLKTTQTIAALNDLFRCHLPFSSLSAVPGMFVTTAGIAALPPEAQFYVWERVRTFSHFTEDNDPHGEHDFGSLEISGIGCVFWKIDYYADECCEFGSGDLTDTEESYASSPSCSLRSTDHGQQHRKH